jgi:putative ABC transport system permease protein
MPVGIDFFPLLGATAAAGRLFQKDDLDRGCTVVLKYQFWMTAFAGQQSIRGKKIELNEKSCDIVGVTSPSFTFYPDAISMWTLITPASEIARDPENAHVGVFGLLRPGVSIAAAQDELSSLSMNQHRHDPKQAGLVPAVYPLGEQFSYLTEPNLRLSVVVLFAAVCLVLLIACVNVANLLLGRSLVRQKEFAVRASLGSGRLRLIRQLLTECLLLSFTGALGGILLAIGAVHCFRTASPIQMPPGSSVSVNLYVLVFAVSLTIATAILFGLIPAWKASQIDVIESLKAKGRTASLSPRTRKLGQLLVTAEVTLSLTLLTGATLLIQSVNRLSAEPLGFNTSSAFTMSIELPEWGYTNSQQRSNFIDNVLRRTALLPGVQAAAFASSLPLNNGRWRQEFLTIQGRPQPNPTVDALDVTDPFVTPAYFRAMGVPLVSGRLFEDRDRKESEPVAIVNEALAGKYFPNQNPIGAHIRIGISPKVSSWLTIVGVVANEKDRDFFNEMAWENIPAVFRPISQQPPLRGSLVVRTVMPSAALGIVIQKYIASLDSRVPVGEPETLDQRVEKLLAYPRFRAAVLSIFATLAVVLAGVGLYGVLSHLTAQRVQEFGVRMVLGARRQDVLLLVIRQGLLVTSAGIAAGLILAMIVAKQLSSLLYGVKSTDPWTLGGVSVALLLVSILATYAPARRAAKLDPLVALRHE